MKNIGRTHKNIFSAPSFGVSGGIYTTDGITTSTLITIITTTITPLG
ncbi:MAG: hypothetical protein PHD21_00980 [Flavobacteriales bacterium]|nr:hypothetical protein [Flavobacteriales bacterium]